MCIKPTEKGTTNTLNMVKIERIARTNWFYLKWSVRTKCMLKTWKAIKLHRAMDIWFWYQNHSNTTQTVPTTLNTMQNVSMAWKMGNACYLEKANVYNKLLQFAGYVRYIDLLYSLHSIISFIAHKSDGKVIEHLQIERRRAKNCRCGCILEVNALVKTAVISNMLTNLANLIFLAKLYIKFASNFTNNGSLSGSSWWYSWWKRNECACIE